MQVALKIWRYDATTGDKALREYEVDAPEEATLLDVLDIVKDRHDGTLAYRKSCRMMICGSCGMRMDGAAVLACKTRMYEIAHYTAVNNLGTALLMERLIEHPVKKLVVASRNQGKLCDGGNSGIDWNPGSTGAGAAKFSWATSIIRIQTTGNQVQLTPGASAADPFGAPPAY